MLEIRGKSVFGGIAIGKICVYKKNRQQIKCVKIEDAEQEIIRFCQAKEESIVQLRELYQKALKEI